MIFIKFLRKNYLILLIIFLGLILRLYRYQEWFIYNHDQDLISWFIKDVIVDGHLRLVGQETSTRGIFIGPIFYYYLIPFYLIFKFDPPGGYFGVLLLGLFAIFSFNFVLSKVFNKTTGLVAALVYTVSTYTLFNDRWMVPTMPVFLWSIWFFYSLHLIFKVKKVGFILAGVLLSLIWHINFALIVITPLIIVAILSSTKKFSLKNTIYMVVFFIVTSLPLFVFELRHNFIQSRSFISALTTNQSDIVYGIAKIEKVLVTMSQTFQTLTLGDIEKASFKIAIPFILILFIYLVRSSALKKPHSVFIGLWLLFYASFFSFYSKILSEYYLDGMVVAYIIMVTLILVKIKNVSKYLFFTALALLTVLHIRGIIKYEVSKDNYKDKKNIISFIKKDSMENEYPCVSVSYITDPGYDLGYRNIIRREGLKLKKIDGSVPVYSIVFPHTKVVHLDKFFGSLGLILPEYNKYQKVKVEENCRGEDYNLEQAMFGFTK